MISKERFAQKELTPGLEGLSVEEKLYRLYDLYCRTGDETCLGDLIHNAERLGFGIAFNQLRENSHFRGGDFMDYLQDISLTLMNKLRREFEIGKRQENIVFTIRRFYKLRAMDIGENLAKKFNGINIQSFEGLNEDEDGNPRDTLGEEDEQFNEELNLAKEKAELSRTLIRMFVENMMNSNESPARLMALCYCRILYQMEMRHSWPQIQAAAEKVLRKDNRTTIPEFRKMMEAIEAVQTPQKKSSPSWALERMGDQTFLELKQDSERSIQEVLGADLSWQQPFLRKLEQPSGCGGATPWKDVVYTEHYSAKRTSAMANEVYGQFVVQLMDQIEADEELDREVQRLDMSLEDIVENLGRRKQHAARDER